MDTLWQKLKCVFTNELVKQNLYITKLYICNALLLWLYLYVFISQWPEYYIDTLFKMIILEHQHGIK